MIFWLKKLVFKFMELGLGLRTCFPLETERPIFVNFRLTPAEAARVQATLPAGFTLSSVRFCEGDSEAAPWVSYNLYEIGYPKPELAHIRKVRCEINTFVRDAEGRPGIFVFCGSPYVSRETRLSIFGMICDLAERAVIAIYGSGKLVPLIYELTDERLRIEFAEGPNRLSIEHALGSRMPAPLDPPDSVFADELRDAADARHLQGGGASDGYRLSEDYWLHNDLSFFNGGRTFDEVYVTSQFQRARLTRVTKADGIGAGSLDRLEMQGPFFSRAPDELYFFRGKVTYLVNAMNRQVRRA